MGEVDLQLLALFARAYDEPDFLQGEDRSLVAPRNITWDVYETTLAHFIDRTAAAAPNEETRLRLRALLAGLRLRPALLPEESMRSLGIYETRAAALCTLCDAFPAAPLVGRPLGEAVLDDEKAFRVVPPSELAAARSSAETLDWRKIPNTEIERAFQINSVYIWLDASSWPFYVPAFLAYSLRHPASQCELHSLLTFLESPPASVIQRWSPDQRRAIALFLAFVADDQPWDSLIIERREHLAAWRASIA